MERLGNDAKAGKIKAEDLQGSTFTITSLGADGGLFATPILNFPEVGILGVHQIKKKPVVIGNADISIPAGEERGLKVQLNKKGRNLVKRHPLKASLKIVATAADGSQAGDDRTVKLVPKTKPK